jgi:hypothetical protein
MLIIINNKSSMLKLTKSVSAENYPLSPQTSSGRKLTLNITPNNPVDLGKSYLIVKNKLTTTLRGVQVVRNVGWGCQLEEDKTVQFPNSVQLRTASLSLDGQVVEYCEDLNIRVANMDGYLHGVDELRKWANVGKYGFQRLEGGRISALTGATVPMMDGSYLSPFVDRPVDVNQVMQAAQYKELPGVIHLSDIFGFCASAGAVNLAGRTVKIELQFEDRFELLAEVINYPANCSVAAPTPRVDAVLPLDPASAQNADGTPIVGVNADGYRIKTVGAYKSVSEVPFYVGQPVCLWLNAAAPVAATNYATISKIQLDVDFRAYITVVQYTVGGAPLASAGAAITAAQFLANVFAGAAGVCVGLSGVYDPRAVAGGNDILQFFSGGQVLGAGVQTIYTITGIEAVMCEMVGMQVAKKTVDYVKYSRDLDTIPAQQLYYQKSFQLDPGCVSIFGVAPPAKLTGQANRNIWHTSTQAITSAGVSMRNMLNGTQLYSRDIVFAVDSQCVEPLQLDRLEMALEALNYSLKNTSTTGQMVLQDGASQHVIIAEAVPGSSQPQQFQVRLSHTINTDARTIYLFKAIVASVQV